MDNLLTSKEAAKRLGYTDQALRSSRSTGKLSGLPAPKHIKLARTVRYQEADLKLWIEENGEVTQ